MKREQKIVALGAASGIVAMLVGTWGLYRLLPTPDGMTDVGSRIAYALRWIALAAVPLFAMVVAVGNARFASDAIDPLRKAESVKMKIDGRAADNTLQQFALFAAGALGLVASLPSECMQLIGAATIVFVVARLAFWIGYRVDPLYRAFGFAATAYLNMGLIGGALVLALR
jgi:uncharacterized MAPEG superfamily protein